MATDILPNTFTGAAASEASEASEAVGPARSPFLRQLYLAMIEFAQASSRARTGAHLGNERATASAAAPPAALGRDDHHDAKGIAMLTLLIAFARIIRQALKNTGGRVFDLAAALLEAMRLSRSASRKYPYIA